MTLRRRQVAVAVVAAVAPALVTWVRAAVGADLAVAIV